MERKNQIEKLKKNSEFKNVFKEKKSLASRGLILYRLPNGYKRNRVGFVSSKKIGNAVARNRTKRLMKEAYRGLNGDILQGYDLVFIAKNKFILYDFREAKEDMRVLMQRSGLLKRVQKKNGVDLK